MRNDDNFWLISREEMELRFRLQPAFTKLWMEVDQAERMPFILVGKTSPSFRASDVFGWLVKHFGHGYEAENPAIAANPIATKTDNFWLISREEMELRFRLQPDFTKRWMEADKGEQLPFTLLGKTGTSFRASDVFNWLVKHFGHGYKESIK